MIKSQKFFLGCNIMRNVYFLFFITFGIAQESIQKNFILDRIYSTSQQEITKYQSGSILHKKFLEYSPSGNGDITSMLRNLSNVQYDNAQLKSTTPGEIDPANISISGGLYYQNLFIVDGMNINNDLDPIGSQTSPSNVKALGGRSQGLNIDVSLIDSIIVMDSNISASYGGFNGGVVETQTKRPTKKFSGKISYQMTQGNIDGFSLTNYHIDSANIQSFLNSTSSDNQPEFIKLIVRSSFESKINDNSGIVTSFSTTQSFIPLNSYASAYISSTLDETNKVQKRQSYNAFIKGYYDINQNFRLEASYMFAPQYNQYFIVNTKDSDFVLQSGGHQFGLKSIWENILGQLNAQFNFTYLSNSRTNSAQHMKGWRYSSEKNWNPDGSQNEGGYGNVDSSQINNLLKITQDFNPLTLGFWKNKFNTGIELGYVYASYHRLEDTLFSGSAYTKPLAQGEICSDLEWCSNAVVDISKLSTSLQKVWENNNGQYIYRATLYKQGLIALNNFTSAFFIEDDMGFFLGRFGNIDSRIGLRTDFDTYMQKLTLAPRFSIKYSSPWKKEFLTQITLGANRYYGRNLFAYALLDGRSSLEYTLIRNSESVSWENASATQNKNDTNFSKLKVPYSDELMVGAMQNVFMFELNTKYIHRFGRDEIRRSCQDANGNLSSLNCSSNTTLTQDLHFVYTNDGYSDTDIVSVSIQNQVPITFFSIKNFFLFAFDWTNTKRNYADYSDILSNSELANQWISYNGELLRYADRPAQNYTRPYTFRLTTTHQFVLFKTKWTLNNFFRLRSGYTTSISVADAYKDSFIIDGVETKVDTFKTYKVKEAFTWDMRFSIETYFYKTNAIFLNFDIYNILDAKNIAIVNLSYLGSSASLSAVPVYELGRSFWIEIGYKF